MKRPAFQFYPADWRKDMALQSCGMAARGLWIDMLCIAHECEPYGHLIVNAKPMTAAQIGRHVGLTERECAKLIAELESAGVPSRTPEGALFCRRMVRDEEIRQKRGEGGKAGGEHGHKGGIHGAKGGRPKGTTSPVSDGTKGGYEVGKKPPNADPIEPPPSSSSSSSLSSSLRFEDKCAEKSATSRPPRPQKAKLGADSLLALGVVQQVADDWLAVRAAKRMPLTSTALEGIQAEAQKAGLDLNSALLIATRRNWGSFDADWLLKSDASRLNSPPPLTPYQRQEEAGRQAREAGDRAIELMANAPPGSPDRRLYELQVKRGAIEPCRKS